VRIYGEDVIRKIPEHQAQGVEEVPLPTGAKNAECGICLSEEMDRPIVLSACQHAFCCTCLQTWDKVYREGSGGNERKASCPMCRSPDATTDVWEHIHTRSKMYYQRASIQPDPEKRKSLFQLSLAEINKASAVETPGSLVHNLTLWKKAGVYIGMGEGEMATDIMQLICSDPAMRRQLSEAKWLGIKNTYAEALVAIGDYASEIDLVYTVIEATTGRVFPVYIQTDAWMLHCCCWYEVGNWDFCTRAGQGAAAMEKHHAGVHKYQALGWKEEGNILMALETIGKAVLCEVDESMGTMEDNIRIFKEIESESQLPSSPIPTVRVSASTTLLGSKCGLCQEETGYQGVILEGCIHRFCQRCIKDWWLRHIRQANNKPIRYKGKQAACPLCYEQISQLPEAERQAFLCDV
jgi:hypothetical protein